VSSRSPGRRCEVDDANHKHLPVGVGLWLVRIGLPATLLTAGLVLLIIGVTLVGVVLIGAAVIAAVVDFFARMTNESELDRDREEQARRTFMRTGAWPRRRR
jgi:hypothetical protein